VGPPRSSRARGALPVADCSIGEAERTVIHRPRWRTPRSNNHSAGIILNRRLRAVGEHLDAQGANRMIPSRGSSCSRRRKPGPQSDNEDIPVGLDSGVVVSDRAVRTGQRGATVSPTVIIFASQRIVEGRHQGTVTDPGLDARVGRKARWVTRPDEGRKLRAGSSA